MAEIEVLRDSEPQSHWQSQTDSQTDCHRQAVYYSGSVTGPGCIAAVTSCHWLPVRLSMLVPLVDSDCLTLEPGLRPGLVTTVGPKSRLVRL